MVMVMKHVCPDEIQSQADFDALGGFLAKVLTCPVITLPGDEGPAGALDADDDFFDQFVAGGTTSFNFSVDAAGGTQDFDDATFIPAKVCETDVNADANGDGMITADVCVEISHYGFEGVAQGDVTITESSPPAGFRFGAIEFTPDSGDEATLVDLDADAGRISLDTSGDADVMVHVYNFADAGPGETPSPTPTPTDTTGPTGMVMVMKHVCPDEIQSQADFDALGGFLAKVLTCPVITLPGDEGPAGALDADDDFFDQFVAGGTTSFNFSVDADGGTQDFDDATFIPAKVCETDVNADANGDGMITADVCVEISHYGFEGVAQGDVTITESSPPAGFRFGAIEFTPDSGDEATLVDLDADAGRISLDTSGDADVMVHVYNFADAGPGETPSGSVGGETGTPEITLPPTDALLEGSTAVSEGWRLPLLALAALLALTLWLSPAPGSVRRRRSTPRQTGERPGRRPAVLVDRGRADSLISADAVRSGRHSLRRDPRP